MLLSLPAPTAADWPGSVEASLTGNDDCYHTTSTTISVPPKHTNVRLIIRWGGEGGHFVAQSCNCLCLLSLTIDRETND